MSAATVICCLACICCRLLLSTPRLLPLSLPLSSAVRVADALYAATVPRSLVSIVFPRMLCVLLMHCVQLVPLYCHCRLLCMLLTLCVLLLPLSSAAALKKKNRATLPLLLSLLLCMLLPLFSYAVCFLPLSAVRAADAAAPTAAATLCAAVCSCHIVCYSWLLPHCVLLSSAATVVCCCVLPLLPMYSANQRC